MAKSEDWDRSFQEVKEAGRRVRALAYLLESHNPEIPPLFDMSEVWSIIGTMLDALGNEIVNKVSEVEDQYLSQKKRKR